MVSTWEPLFLINHASVFPTWNVCFDQDKPMKSQMFSGKRWLCFASRIKCFQWCLGSFLWGNTKSFMRSNSMSSQAQFVPSIQICLWSFVKSCSRICLELASLNPFLQAPFQAHSSQVYYLNCELPQKLSKFPFELSFLFCGSSKDGQFSSASGLPGGISYLSWAISQTWGQLSCFSGD